MIDFNKLGVYKLIKGIIICNLSGTYLVDLILDSDIDPILLSSFVGALSLFGKNNLGKIREIKIIGLDVDMVIVSKYELVLIYLLDKKINKKGLREQAEDSLDLFYKAYGNSIHEEICIDKFSPFKEILLIQVIKFFEKFDIEIEISPEEEEKIKGKIIGSSFSLDL
ncbi:MAG: hypothetical protein ACTSR8_11415 [Promethearchaeota archaeon]